MLDPAVAEAAFKAEVNKPVLVTEGALQPSIVHGHLDRAGIGAFACRGGSAASARISPSAPRARARDDLYDQVEDERAGGATLEEAAAKLKLPYRVDRRDLGRSEGARTASWSRTSTTAAAVVKEAFESDVGVENSPVRGVGESWVFFDVLEIIPARDRTLDEVRDEVVAAWTDEGDRRPDRQARGFAFRQAEERRLACLSRCRDQEAGADGRRRQAERHASLRSAKMP